MIISIDTGKKKKFYKLQLPFVLETPGTGVPAVVQRAKNLTTVAQVAGEVRVLSLDQHSQGSSVATAVSIGCMLCHSCKHRLHVSIGCIQSLAQELPYAMDAAIKF